MTTWLIFVIIHTTAVVKLEPEKNSDLNGIRTHDLCNTGEFVYKVTYQAIWELVTLWVPNIPVEGEECKWIYERLSTGTLRSNGKIFIKTFHSLEILDHMLYELHFPNGVLKLFWKHSWLVQKGKKRFVIVLLESLTFLNFYLN